MPLVSLDRVSIAFGYLPLLQEAALRIDAGERVAVVGRNGSGKSTLLQLLAGDRSPDAGSVSFQPGVRVGRLEQDVPLSTNRSVFDVVADGLGDLSRLVTTYHHAAVSVADGSTPERLDALGRLQEELELRDGWRFEQRVALVIARLSLPSEAIVDTLSGGWRRRVLLARTLVAQPEILLLDEPTNHLDLDAIAWLETFLAEYAGAVVFVTHDRAFLQRLATRIVEIDRGRLTSWPGDYDTFVRRKEEWLANEAVRQEKFDRRLAEEEAWLRQGIKARRTRNEGRVRALMAMRQERQARRAVVGTVRLSTERSEPSGRVVFDADQVTKGFGGTAVIDDLTVRIMRGDRVGLIGPNGAGKTTLLRILLGELAPDRGEVERGANVEVAYYDQQREQLDPDRSLFDTLGDGNDVVTVNGRTRHVNAYLQDFLFPAERATAPVRALSGGERNRLLLARLFTRPANVLILDEPTNDLDLETLELLEEELLGWPGTLLLVSHDRAFLDNVVTSTLVFEGQGEVQEYIGGYTDWQRQREAARAAARADATAASAPVAGRSSDASSSSSPSSSGASADSRKKLTYKEQRELETLPQRIDTLEEEKRVIGTSIAAPEFYRQSHTVITQALARAEELERLLHELYARWDALESRARPAAGP